MSMGKRFHGPSQPRRACLFVGSGIHRSAARTTCNFKTATPVVYGISGRGHPPLHPPCRRPPAPLCLTIRLRLLGNFGWTQGQAEPADDAAARRVAPVPVRRPTNCGLEDTTAPTEHAGRALFSANRIGDRPVRILTVPIRAPLHDVAMHVIQSPSVPLLLTNRMCLTITIFVVPSVITERP